MCCASEMSPPKPIRVLSPVGKIRCMSLNRERLPNEAIAHFQHDLIIILASDIPKSSAAKMMPSLNFIPSTLVATILGSVVCCCGVPWSGPVEGWKDGLTGRIGSTF
jgi:hypothetical protein